MLYCEKMKEGGALRAVVLPSTNPYWNQACEEVLFLRRSLPLLILWRNAPTVICGKYQNIYAEVSPAAAAAMGIAVIRRETGGGTVYHDEGNLNYAIMCPKEGIEGYAPFLEQIVGVLRRLGVDASQGRLCDISVDGKKVSGNAQKVTRERVWHHGTLLFSADLHRLHTVANGAGREYASKGVQSSPWPVANLGEYLPGMDVLSFRDAILRELDAEPVPLTAEEIAEADRLEKEKYRAWDWTYGHNPAFTLTRETPFGTLYMESSRGVIAQCNLEPSLTGVRLDPQEPRLLTSPLLPYLF